MFLRILMLELILIKNAVDRELTIYSLEWLKLKSPKSLNVGEHVKQLDLSHIAGRNINVQPPGQVIWQYLQK